MEESYSVSNGSRARGLPVISNNSEFLIQSNYNRTEYRRGPLCVRFIVKRESH